MASRVLFLIARGGEVRQGACHVVACMKGPELPGSKVCAANPGIRRSGRPAAEALARVLHTGVSASRVGGGTVCEFRMQSGGADHGEGGSDSLSESPRPARARRGVGVPSDPRGGHIEDREWLVFGALTAPRLVGGLTARQVRLGGDLTAGAGPARVGCCAGPGALVASASPFATIARRLVARCRSASVPSCMWKHRFPYMHSPRA